MPDGFVWWRTLIAVASARAAWRRELRWRVYHSDRRFVEGLLLQLFGDFLHELGFEFGEDAVHDVG